MFNYRMGQLSKDNRSEYLQNLDCARKEFIVNSSKTESFSAIDRNILDKVFEECCVPVDDTHFEEDVWDGIWDDPEAEYNDWDDDFECVDRDYNGWDHDEWDAGY